MIWNLRVSWRAIWRFRNSLKPKWSAHMACFLSSIKALSMLDFLVWDDAELNAFIGPWHQGYANYLMSVFPIGCWNFNCFGNSYHSACFNVLHGDRCVILADTKLIESPETIRYKMVSFLVLASKECVRYIRLLKYWWMEFWYGCFLEFMIPGNLSKKVNGIAARVSCYTSLVII